MLQFDVYSRVYKKKKIFDGLITPASLGVNQGW